MLNLTFEAIKRETKQTHTYTCTYIYTDIEKKHSKHTSRLRASFSMCVCVCYDKYIFKYSQFNHTKMIEKEEKSDFVLFFLKMMIRKINFPVEPPYSLSCMWKSKKLREEKTHTTK